MAVPLGQPERRGALLSTRTVVRVARVPAWVGQAPAPRAALRPLADGPKPVGLSPAVVEPEAAAPSLTHALTPAFTSTTPETRLDPSARSSAELAARLPCWRNTRAPTSTARRRTYRQWQRRRRIARRGSWGSSSRPSGGARSGLALCSIERARWPRVRSGVGVFRSGRPEPFLDHGFRPPSRYDGEWRRP